MCPEASSSSTEPVNLSRLVSEMDSELRCLLGPKIRLGMNTLPEGGAAEVCVEPREIVDLLRHLALDAHSSMPDGGAVTIRTGRLREVNECAAIVIHEVPKARGPRARRMDEADPPARVRKGRSLGLGASFDAVEHVGGHFHVSCRGRETVLTICFPLAG